MVLNTGWIYPTCRVYLEGGSGILVTYKYTVVSRWLLGKVLWLFIFYENYALIWRVKLNSVCFRISVLHIVQAFLATATDIESTVLLVLPRKQVSLLCSVPPLQLLLFLLPFPRHPMIEKQVCFS